MKNILALILSVLFCLPFFLIASAEETVQPIDESSVPDASNAAAAAVYNIENDCFVYEHNIDLQIPPASLVKMMTALCAYTLFEERLDETVTVEYSMISAATGNQVGYYVGETVSVRDLFGGLLTRGANDSAYILAALAGGVDSFVSLMNATALELGMTQTTFKNPTGMTAEGMTTTARDMIILAKAFYGNSFLTSISSALKYTMPQTNKASERVIYNRNALASKVGESGYFDSRIIALNAGSTAESGYYTASATVRETTDSGEKLSYIIIVMGAKTVDERNTAYTFASELATYARSEFDYIDVIKPTGVVCEIPVMLSTDADYVTLVPAESLTLYLRSDVDPKTDLTYTYRLDSEYLEAPVTGGEKAGVYTVSLGGEILGSVDLVTKNSLSRSEFLVILDGIERFTKSVFFLAAVIAAIVLTILYFALRSLFRRSRRRRKYYRGR